MNQFLVLSTLLVIFSLPTGILSGAIRNSDRHLKSFGIQGGEREIFQRAIVTNPTIPTTTASKTTAKTTLPTTTITTSTTPKPTVSITTTRTTTIATNKPATQTTGQDTTTTTTSTMSPEIIEFCNQNPDKCSVGP